MKEKIYKIIPTDDGQYALYQDDSLILQGDRPTVTNARDRRVNSTITAIRQHGQEPKIGLWSEGEAELLSITWQKTKPHELRCLKLPAASWKRLEQLAEQTASHAKTGRYTGQPSWRTLIRRIADGELVIQPRDAVTEKQTPAS